MSSVRPGIRCHCEDRNKANIQGFFSSHVKYSKLLSMTHRRARID